MKISAKTEYACIAMLELALQHESDEPVRIREIAQRHNVPARFLVQILLQLKGAGLVASVRGASGGYQLIVPPEDIPLGKIMEVIEGNPEESNQSSAATDSPIVQVLWQAWNEIAEAQKRALAHLTLADLIERVKSHNAPMYHI
jgi:Rrf2 family protein